MILPTRFASVACGGAAVNIGFKVGGPRTLSSLRSTTRKGAMTSSCLTNASVCSCMIHPRLDPDLTSRLRHRGLTKPHISNSGWSPGLFPAGSTGYMQTSYLQGNVAWDIASDEVNALLCLARYLDYCDDLVLIYGQLPSSSSCCSRLEISPTPA